MYVSNSCVISRIITYLKQLHNSIMNIVATALFFVHELTLRKTNILYVTIATHSFVWSKLQMHKITLFIFYFFLWYCLIECYKKAEQKDSRGARKRRTVERS